MKRWLKISSIVAAFLIMPPAIMLVGVAIGSNTQSIFTMASSLESDWLVYLTPLRWLVWGAVFLFWPLIMNHVAKNRNVVLTRDKLFQLNKLRNTAMAMVVAIEGFTLLKHVVLG
ncbi:hypothetical protein KW507_15790 [Vibrio fluvialis]|uniref:hypothetical protein n=1 Tax=Vibrio fluvialis TaxID=676 RepID=UPI00192B96CD|nr:hypothetical protein [Vibrio fluvialis]MBL4262799.1 hypothetical protein [Vibrio fluvialis]MBY8168136.1 hypothetical protein [Vibrio fluvialis]